jgi:hypothetical protein
MLDAIELPEETYGPFVVSWGNSNTRIITLRNLTWEKANYTLSLDEETGLAEDGEIEVRQLHPTENVLGSFNFGEKVNITVEPYRSCLLIISSKPIDEPAILGTDFNVIKNIDGQAVEIEVLGWPGTSAEIKLSDPENYQSALVDGKQQKDLLKGKSIKIDFPGKELKKDILRKISYCEVLDTLESIDWQALYEATVFSADNNALEVRSIQRSGWSEIPEVKAAQDAFFNQQTFMGRGIWDKNIFDGSMETAFWPSKKYNRDQKVYGGCFRLDLGEITDIDKLVIKVGDIFSLQPLLEGEGNYVEVSTDLKNWETLTYLAGTETEIHFDKPVRYLRFKYSPSCIREIEGYKNGKALDTSLWRASNLFAHPSRLEHQKTWKSEFVLDEIAPNSYLCIALNGLHGVEGAYVAALVNGEFRGAPDRAQSFPSNTWEYINSRSDKNYTYYIPVDKEDEGKPIEIFVLGFDEEHLDFKPEVWIAAYPIPYEKMTLKLNVK